jgi:hypothetical protein
MVAGLNEESQDVEAVGQPKKRPKLNRAVDQWIQFPF